jgi:hypothetical protein
MFLVRRWEGCTAGKAQDKRAPCFTITASVA